MPVLIFNPSSQTYFRSKFLHSSLIPVPAPIFTPSACTCTQIHSQILYTYFTPVLFKLFQKRNIWIYQKKKTLWCRNGEEFEVVWRGITWHGSVWFERLNSGLQFYSTYTSILIVVQVFLCLNPLPEVGAINLLNPHPSMCQVVTQYLPLELVPLAPCKTNFLSYLPFPKKFFLREGGLKDTENISK